MPQKKTLAFYGGQILAYGTLALIALACFLPFLLIISVSFTSDTALKLHGYSLVPSQWSADAYVYVFDNGAQILKSYGVTASVTVLGTFFGMFLMTALAYPLSREDFRYRNVISFLVYFTMLFSGGLVPSYILISRYLQLKNTLLALILPVLMNAYYVMILRTYFKEVPAALIEAAYMEGAGEYKIFFRIVLPLARTGIATVALFMCLMYWNEWFLSMLYIDKDLVSLQFLLYRMLENLNFIKQNASAASMGSIANVPDESVRMAICAVATGPMICVFPFFQRYFTKGVTLGAVKG